MSQNEQIRRQINLDHFDRCITALDAAYKELQLRSSDEIIYEIYRSACIKEFEIILEQCGKLLKKKLQVFFSSNKAIDEMSFKDIFRYSAKHGLINLKASEQWLEYRDIRNKTTHSYGHNIAESVLKILPEFIDSAKKISKSLHKKNKDET